MAERTLLFTDLVDSTRLVERLGDARAAEIWAEHDRSARALLQRHRGREIDRSDGFFLLFDNANDGARFALDYQQAMTGLALAARVGLHTGSVTLRGNDAADIARGAKPVEVDGLAKPMAARIMALARGGQTLLSASARATIGEAAPGAEIVGHGHYRLKGVEEPVEIFELGARDACAFTPPPDTDKAYRVALADGLWRPRREVRHNLVAERDAFIGRSAELRTLARRLDAGSRLVTVLGTGGTGKTRLIHRYGLTWLGDWPGGVYFCDLSEAKGLDGIHFAVAFALGVPLGKDDPALQLGHAIAGRGRCLMILDNFEQVVEHAPATIGRWLDRAGKAAFVVTSRERLHLAGEEIFAVESLALDTEAIELFAARARAQRPQFAVDAGNRAAVADVVRLLDGLPLAIELAAARVRVMSPGQIVERMKDRFELLAGARGAAARQATLRAAIDWSWQLLTPWEQAALAQSSVFEGGFTLAAAEAVLDLHPGHNGPSTMDIVQSLVDKSLLRAWVPAEQRRYDIDEPHFGMYLSIHEYAAEKLEAGDAGATSAARRRHGTYFAGFGSDKAIEALSGHGGIRQRGALTLEIDNLIVACRRAIAASDPALALPTLRAAWEVLDLQGPLATGHALGSQVLALASLSGSQRVDAGMTQASALARVGRTAEAAACLELALEGCTELGDRRREGVLLNLLGNVCRELGQMVPARARLEAALEIQREVGHALGEATALAGLGTFHSDQGRLAAARECFEAALVIHRRIGNIGAEGRVLCNLATVDGHEGRYESARAAFETAYAISRQVGDLNTQGRALGNLANLEAEQGRMDDARAHYEAAIAIHRDVGGRRSEGLNLGNLATLCQSQGLSIASPLLLDEARVHYEAALAIAREVGHRRDEGIVLGNLGSLYCLLEDPVQDQKAHLCFDQALVIDRALGNRRDEGIVLGNLASLLIKQRRLEQALDSLRAGEILLREVGDVLELGKLLCVRGRAQLAQGDGAAARDALDDARVIAERLRVGPESDLGSDIARLGAALVAQCESGAAG